MLSSPAANILHARGEADRNIHAIHQARMSALGIEHDDLDAAIDALIRTNASNDLIIARLKKRKLQIRDEIAGLAAAAGWQNQTRGAIHV